MEFDKSTLVITEIEFLEQSMIISWRCNLGFGEVNLLNDKRFNLWVDDDNMGREFIEVIFEKLLEQMRLWSEYV